MHACSIHRELEIVPGDMSDYRQLAAHHYRDGRPVGIKAVYAVRPKRALGSLGRRPAGVIVYAMPNPRIELRTLATSGAFHGWDRQTELTLLNRHVRCLARVIIEPRFRGIGLAVRLVRETMPRLNVPIIDAETDILLATLNRLGGRDMLDRKLALLRRLSVTLTPRELAQLLPQTRGQLERLINATPARAPSRTGRVFATPIVFFADEAQERVVAQALTRAAVGLPEGLTRAAQRTAALARLARSFLDQGDPPAPADTAPLQAAVAAGP